MWQRNGEGQDASGVHGELAGFFGTPCTIQGTLRYEGSMRIDGRMEGEIVTDGSLIIGEGGHVRAEIKAGVVVCGGTIEGNIIARERVQLLAPAVLTGTVHTPLLIIEEGAQFNGSCEMKERAASSAAGRAGRSSQTKTIDPKPEFSHD
jgi:cytoskeletal protein CcmA (bactofilin family)